MPLSAPVTVPVSALNIGVAGALPGIQAQVTELQIDLTKLGVIVTDLLPILALNLPTTAALGPAFALHLAHLPTIFLPTNWVKANVGFSADVGVQLGIVDLALELVTKIAASLELGLTTGGLQTWTYLGPAGKFASALAAAVGRDARAVQGFVVACESLDNWGKFSVTFNTGSTTTQGQLRPGESKLTYLGGLTGAQLNTGAFHVKQVIDLYLLHLTGLRATLQAKLDLSLGVTPPNVTGITANLKAALPHIDLMVENLINVKFDPQVHITGINARIDAFLKLIGTLSASLSGGGLTFWSYNGQASGLGTELAAQTSGRGLPGGSGPDATIYAVATICASPSAFADFSLIFGRAA